MFNSFEVRLLTELDALILVILRDRGEPAHGSDLGKEAQIRTNDFVPAATLYRRLHELEDQGYLAGDWEGAERRQPHRGPQRRYYRLTGQGSRAIRNYERLLALRVKALGWGLEPTQ